MDYDHGSTAGHDSGGGSFSTIHLLGRLGKEIFCPDSAGTEDRFRAGQGKMVDAATVMIDARNVAPKSVEMTEWRWWLVIRKSLSVRAIRSLTGVCESQ